MGKDERIRIYYRKITLGLTAPISTAQVSLLWFMMWSCIHSTSFEPWFWYDQVIPRDGADQRLNFLLVWYFNVKTICWEGLLQRSCRLTTHWNNYVPTLMFAAGDQFLQILVSSPRDSYHTPSCIYTLPPSEFQPRHYHKPYCYVFCLRLLYYWPSTLAEGNSHEVEELADAVAFLQGLSAPTHTLIYTAAGWKTCTGLFGIGRGARKLFLHQ